MIREFVQTIDDHEWQQQLFQLLQSQSHNQCEVDLFELMCKVLDQNLFSQVDWARNTVFFKDLKVSANFTGSISSHSNCVSIDQLPLPLPPNFENLCPNFDLTLNWGPSSRPTTGVAYVCFSSECYFIIWSIVMRRDRAATSGMYRNGVNFKILIK